MESFQVYKDMKARTNGEIYIGVVGPVRTGKSTFIKRFADLLILPNLTDVHKKERTKDELPQSASGTTIMTTEPKFVPKEAVSVKLGEDVEVKMFRPVILFSVSCISRFLCWDHENESIVVGSYSRSFYQYPM